MDGNEAACAAMTDDACTQLEQLQVQLELLPPHAPGRLALMDQIELLEGRVWMLEMGSLPASRSIGQSEESRRAA